MTTLGIPVPSTPSLDARYEIEDGAVFLSGIQALVRLPIEQMRRDRQAGLRTRAFISGYPGSPLGGYDLALNRAASALEAHGVMHRPGQNEELAATTLMGTQMLDEHPHPDLDGVVAYWYGKGPGLDRSGDALKHGNFAGTSTHGAVVILSGEDHEAKSSTVPYQQEHAFEHHGIPVLYPSSVQEFVEYGLHAAALSRYSGCWVALKLVGPLCDGGEVVRFSPQPALPRIPQLSLDGKPFRKIANFQFFPVKNIATERQLYVERHAAVRAYAELNELNRVVVSTPTDRIGIVSAGKSYADTRQALHDMGFDDDSLRAAGIRLAKIGMSWPLERAFVRRFGQGLPRIIVVEEKRDFIERQLGHALCEIGPVQVLGKHDADGSELFPVEGGMNGDLIARVLGRVLARELTLPAAAEERLAELDALGARGESVQPKRSPNYCSGCPHNVSTKLAPGQVAWGAPGCHIFAALMDKPDKRIEAVTQLGGEGLPWIGLAPFTSRKHMVQNLGDGSLMHSSYQNIRFAATAGVNITFKILFNGVIANTGGQRSVGAPSIVTLLSHLVLEGVSKIVLIAKELPRYEKVSLPYGVLLRDVSALEASMKELEATPGTTILLYDGECANERRRQQKRGKLPAPTRFTVVNEDVCENCGDCGRTANCMSLQKVDTEFGAKTQIHQSSCNQDRACLGGECPSFVTVEVKPGTEVRRPAPAAIDDAAIPQPRVPALDLPYNVYIPGLGGTGVLTANAILAQAAALDGTDVKSYDQTGAAQKWGPVVSSLVLSSPANPSITNRVGAGRAHLYLALDLLAGVDAQNLASCGPATRAVVNTGLLPSGEMIRDPQLAMPIEHMLGAIRSATQGGTCIAIDARRIAEGLFGDYVMANMVTIGAAYQAGLLPITASSIEAAIRLNGSQEKVNILAFRAGRLAQHDHATLERMLARPYETLADRLEENACRGSIAGDRRIDDMMAAVELPDDEAGYALRAKVRLRAEDLMRYQNAAYARRYVQTVGRVARLERAVLGEPTDPSLAGAVARNLHKLMSYKDEYEVARLLTQRTFARRVEEMFTGPVRMVFNLQPPFMRWFGLKGKIGLGPWMRPVLQALACMKFVRGTPFDPFGYGAVRRQERDVLRWYTELVESTMSRLTPATRALALELLSLPEGIRGYEHIKTEGIHATKMKAAELNERFALRETSARVIRVSPAPVT